MPVHLGGTGAMMPPGRSWMVRPPGAGAMSRHTVIVRFGAVFLTGGSGFIGGQLAVALLARGDEVVALARSEESARSLGSRGVEVARGDVLDRDTLVRAMAGCEIVHHVAGVNSHCPRDPGQLWRVNVVGPQNVVDAAVRQGVMRVVFTSSAASLGEPHGTIGNESTPHRGAFLSIYEQSKYVGERAVFAAAEAKGLPFVALNPTPVQGPPRTGGNGAIIIAFLNRRLRAFVETHVSLTCGTWSPRICWPRATAGPATATC